MLSFPWHSSLPYQQYDLLKTLIILAVTLTIQKWQDENHFFNQILVSVQGKMQLFAKPFAFKRT